MGSIGSRYSVGFSQAGLEYSLGRLGDFVCRRLGDPCASGDAVEGPVEGCFYVSNLSHKPVYYSVFVGNLCICCSLHWLV